MKLLFKFLPQFCDFVQKYFIQIGCTLLVLYCLWPSRFASHYEYLTADEIFNSLIQRTTKNVTMSQQMECDYSDIIMDNTYMYKTSYQSEIFDSTEIQLGGVYQPGESFVCLARLGHNMILRFKFTLLGNLFCTRTTPQKMCQSHLNMI